MNNVEIKMILFYWLKYNFKIYRKERYSNRFKCSIRDYMER